MLTYRPRRGGKGMPLVVVLHGCAQGAETFARQAGWLALADRYGFVVVAAEQSGANNPNRCFNWFEPKDTRRGEGESASIAAMVAHAVRTEGVDPMQVYVTGLSAGGAMTAVMLVAYPEVFAGGAVVAGLPYGVAQGMMGAMQAMQGGGSQTPTELGDLVRNAEPACLPARIAIWHGDSDYTVRPQNASDVARQWADLHGLSGETGMSETLSDRTRTVWRAGDSSETLIELNLVHGLGHGAPLSAAGEDGVGSAGPYMLEAGISSSLEIARFWGLAEGAAPSVTAAPGSAAKAANTKQPMLVAVGDQVMSSLTERVAPAVQHVIEMALKRAGLRH
ncbi:MAG TPA: PHB depolymerase family esterase [Phenylobacterium sp.]|nr:PHB depolymerase family esterase [Phenylobacterium sp.]